ncbi:hypothetical protein [Robiginitalea sediminis]|uniref:hypothetical protein n=1 Tax=Robiginitalea sediminis TaxID=1982593 RepID=UPI00117B37BF|nr:hypothetical protein [Robiginitalea sediminis]
MRHYILLLLGVLLLMQGCSSDDSGEDRRTLLTFTENTAVIPPDPDAPVQIATVGSGDKRVFRYEFTIDSDPQIADSGFSEILIFEVDAALTSFTATGLALVRLSPYYRQSCFCETNDSFPVTSGTISGNRRSQTEWEVDIDVSFLYGSIEKELQVSGIFKLAN